MSGEELADLLGERRLARYVGGQKTTTSLLTKLLVKKEHHAATIHDRVRFRFIVDHPKDIVDLISLMTARLFPFNYVAPGQTVTLDVPLDVLARGLRPEHGSSRPRAAVRPPHVAPP